MGMMMVTELGVVRLTESCVECFRSCNEVQIYKGSYRVTEIRSYRVTGLRSYGDTEIRRYGDTGLQSTFVG